MGYGSPAWASLIAQIRREPSSTELRDIAADYLIAHDDPRGELERERPWAAQLEALGLSSQTTFSGFIEDALLDHSTFPRLPERCRHEPIPSLACSCVDPLRARDDRDSRHPVCPADRAGAALE